jgi:dCTP deaminase
VILSDREIQAALDRGSIRITPDPRSDSSLWSSTAVDLRPGERGFRRQPGKLM